MNYFGYGGNLDLPFLREFCPSAEFIRKAYLPNYEVQFRYWSPRRQGGVSSIIAVPGKLVHGVIYDIRAEELQALDAMEGVPEGRYRRETFLVIGDDGKWYDADLYSVVEPKGPFIPNKGYVELMLAGAKAWEFDPEYIKWIEELYSKSE